MSDSFDPAKRRRIRAAFRQGDPWAHDGYDLSHPHLANCPNWETPWDVTIAFGKGFGRVGSIADMSCGDAYITRALAEYSGVEPLLGDLTPGHEYQGELHDTVVQIPRVELFVCTNTAEHLDDPDADLALVRERCDKMLFSVAVDEWGESAGDHYWAWSREGVEEMLAGASFQVSAYLELDMTPHWYRNCKFGMWALR